MTKPAEHIPAEHEDWREGLLKRIQYALVAVAAFSGIAIIVAATSDYIRFIGLFALAASLLIVAVLSTRRISIFARSLFAVTVISVSASVSFFGAGFLAGPAVCIAFALVAAALLFGRRAFVTMLMLFALLPGVAIFLIHFGYWNGPPRSDTDPLLPVNWLRTGLISVVMWAAIGVSVLYVKEAVERNLRRREKALAEKEEALERLRTETESRRAAEDAREQAEETAVQAQKLDAIGRLAAGVAHDFNNSLLVIQGWNELRQGSISTELDEEASEAIAQAAQMSTLLTRQLLTFARKDVRTPTYLAIDELVAETSKTLRRLLPTNIELRVIAEAKATVHVDRAQLQQVLINLAINARDALPDGGELIIRSHVPETLPAQLSDQLTDGDDGWIVIEVVDNGVGMDEAAREMAFEPFFTTKSTSQGTGLGLATSYGIVRQSDGHIEIESEPGFGTVVRVFLPTRIAEAPNEPVAAEPQADDRLSGRVLLVEDNLMALELFKRLLEEKGLTVVACEDGDAAVTSLASESHPFDMLITDAVYPGAPVTEVVETFQQHSPGAGVLICSGYVLEKLTLEDLQAGTWEFLGKPFKTDDLISKVRSLVRQPGTATVPK